jgi:hypothetical protein
MHFIVVVKIKVSQKHAVTNQYLQLYVILQSDRSMLSPNQYMDEKRKKKESTNLFLLTQCD